MFCMLMNVELQPHAWGVAHLSYRVLEAMSTECQLQWYLIACFLSTSARG